MDTVRNSTTAGTLTTFESFPDGLRISTGSQSCVAKFDGKDYPVTGDSEGNTRSLKKIDDHTFKATNKKDGKVTTSGRIVIAADGKTRTVILDGTDSTGKKTHSEAVYDKQ